MDEYKLKQFLKLLTEKCGECSIYDYCYRKTKNNKDYKKMCLDTMINYLKEEAIYENKQS